MTDEFMDLSTTLSCHGLDIVCCTGERKWVMAVINTQGASGETVCRISREAWVSALGVSLRTNVPTWHFDAPSLCLTSDRCLHTINLMRDISDNVLTDSSKLLCSTCSVTIVVQIFNALFFWNPVLSSCHLTVSWC